MYVHERYIHLIHIVVAMHFKNDKGFNFYKTQDEIQVTYNF